MDWCLGATKYNPDAVTLFSQCSSLNSPICSSLQAGSQSEQSFGQRPERSAPGLVDNDPAKHTFSFRDVSIPSAGASTAGSFNSTTRAEAPQGSCREFRCTEEKPPLKGRMCWVASRLSFQHGCKQDSRQIWVQGWIRWPEPKSTIHSIPGLKVRIIQDGSPLSTLTLAGIQAAGQAMAGVRLPCRITGTTWMECLDPGIYCHHQEA